MGWNVDLGKGRRPAFVTSNGSYQRGSRARARIVARLVRPGLPTQNSEEAEKENRVAPGAARGLSALGLAFEFGPMVGQ